jgi:hypothetical protein
MLPLAELGEYKNHVLPWLNKYFKFFIVFDISYPAR